MHRAAPAPSRDASSAYTLLPTNTARTATPISTTGGGTHTARPPCAMPSALGSRIDPGHDHRVYKRVLARAGMRSRRLPDLRHRAATLLFAQGVLAHVVMQILAHTFGSPN